MYSNVWVIQMFSLFTCFPTGMSINSDGSIPIQQCMNSSSKNRSTFFQKRDNNNLQIDLPVMNNLSFSFIL